MKNAHNRCFVGVYFFTFTCLQLIIQISVKKLYVFNGFSWIRIQPFFIQIRIWIQENDTDSTDPDPPHCYWYTGLSIQRRVVQPAALYHAVRLLIHGNYWYAGLSVRGEY